MSDAAERLLSLTPKELAKLPADVREKIEAVREQVLAANRLRTVQVARDSLLAFTEMSMPDPAQPGDARKTRYRARPVHKLLIEKLEAVERGEILRLCISVQPRVGKSELVSKKFPAWAMGRDPYRQFIVTSYGEELAKEFGRDVRATMQSPFYGQVFPEVTLRRGSRAMDRLQTEAGGIASFVGAGGALTGRGADCVSFDTCCITRNGVKPISDIRVGDKVLAHDHTKGTDTWTTVRAVSVQHKPKLINFGPLRCTPDHRIWTEERGYVEAEKAGDGTPRLCEMPAGFHTAGEGAPQKPASPRGERENVLFEGVLPETSGTKAPRVQVRRGEGEACAHVQGVLSAGQNSETGLRRVRKLFPAAIARAQKECRAIWGFAQAVLQSGVLRQVPSGEPSAVTCTAGVLPHVRRPDSGLPCEKILFERVLSATEGEKPRVHRDVEQAPSGGGATRQGPLRKLWCSEKTGRSAPHRPRPHEPQDGQSRPPVRAVSRPLSSAVLGASAGGLARLLPEVGGHLVADIQTDTGNFFANGVLVHNCLLVDDIIKDSEQARSRATKDGHWEWFTRVALSRVMGRGGAVVITMTRWAEDDLVGRLTDPELGYVSEAEAAKWEVINIPAFADEDDPLGREPGEILWEERTPRKFLESFRALDPAGFAALYMGRPAPPEGNFFRRKDILPYQAHELPRNLRFYAASDHAISTAQNRDSTCMGVVGVDEEDTIWILPDLVWAKLPADDQVEAMLALMGQHKPLVWWAEKGHISKSIGPFLRKRMLEEQVFCTISEKTPVKDKQTRAQSIQARMSMGKVRFPSFAPWYQDAVEQLLNFPNGAHDDFVDFVAWVGLGLSTQVRAQGAAPRKDKSPPSGSLEWILDSANRIRRRNKSTENHERYLH